MVELEGGGSFRLQKMRGRVSFSFSLKYHAFKCLCDKRFNRLRYGVLVFWKCIEDLAGPAHEKEEKERERAREWERGNKIPRKIGMLEQTLKNTSPETPMTSFLADQCRGKRLLQPGTSSSLTLFSAHPLQTAEIFLSLWSLLRIYTVCY